jgi:nucleotide-binding universal stress UspA family protein/hemerythrin-like domain-containing protein
MYRHLLVPTDGTELSTETISRAVDFAKSIGARITFMHARADYAADSEGVLLYAMSPEAFADQAAGDSRALLAKAEAAARARAVPCQLVIRTSDRPYEAILETALERGCDLIFMASHGRKGIKGMLLGSQTLKVLAEATIPVLVSTSAANMPSPAMTRAVGILQDEHRSLAAVVHALNFLVQSFRQGAQPDFRLLRAMLYYIAHFSERLHHPKEDDYIFDRLARRTDEAAEVLSRLRQEHIDDHQLEADLGHTLGAFEAAPETGLEAFAESVARYSEFIWKHMGAEEKLILTAARKHLLEEDWIEIARAFGENGDPRFGDDVGDDFHTLFTRILNLMPEPPRDRLPTA